MLAMVANETTCDSGSLSACPSCWTNGIPFFLDDSLQSSGSAPGGCWWNPLLGSSPSSAHILESGRCEPDSSLLFFKHTGLELWLVVHRQAVLYESLWDMCYMAAVFLSLFIYLILTFIYLFTNLFYIFISSDNCTECPLNCFYSYVAIELPDKDCSNIRVIILVIKLLKCTCEENE